jgi:hypothetical protein
MLPTVTFDANKNDTYTFTLWRDGKKVVHEFKGFSVSINRAYETVIHGASSVGIHGVDENICTPEDRAKIEGPAFEGVFYYICAQPFQGECSMIWLTKEEFEVLDPILNDIQEELYQKSFEYDYKSKTMKEIGTKSEDNGSEQGFLNACPACGGAFVGSVYRPHCESCSWDSNDAYKEHPLDHE